MSFQNLNRKLNQMDRTRAYGAKKNKKKVAVRFIVFLLILVLAIYLPARGIYSSAKSLSSESKDLSLAFKNQNLDDMKSSVVKMNATAGSLNTSINFLIWMQLIPFLGGYYSDARHLSAALNDELSAAVIIVDSLTPYKDELGFNGSPAPGQDKISQMVKILDKVLPNIDKIEPQLKMASDEVSSIDTNKYPEKIAGRNLKSLIETAKNFITGANLAVTTNRSALQVAPAVLGEPNTKTYLVLFQNDKELRATGGFMTAYAFIKLDHGHVSATTSDDIYRLDEKLLNVCLTKICPLTPPAPIVKYLPEANGQPRTAWSMRDSNLSPDLPTSMKQFETMYSYLGDGLPFDGIITIDTEVVRNMISITGPVDVYGTSFSADLDKRCNCPNVIYELENYSEIVAKGQSDRKAILGVLMQQILSKALTTSTDKMPEFINAMAQLAGGKHMMFYMHDSSAESAFSDLNWTGQIRATNGDYLHINDSNFAGGKSNIYVNEDVSLTIDKSSRKHTLTINYSNPQPYNSWLNSINRDYIRVYVPAGSTLISSKGSDEQVDTISDLGKSVFEAFIQIRPQNSRSLTFEYSTPPGSSGGNYDLLIQKQPGSKDYSYSVKLDSQNKSFNLTSDTDLKF